MKAILLLIASLLFAAPDAFTHPLPDSTIFLDVGREQVEAELRLPAAQFEIGFGKPVPRTSEALSAALRRDIARYVTDHLTASHRDGTVWCTQVRDVEIVIEPGAGAHVYVTAALVPPSPATPRNFVLRTDLVVHELLTHRLFVYLRRDWKLRAASFEPFVLGRITYRTSDLAIDLFEGEPARRRDEDMTDDHGGAEAYFSSRAAKSTRQVRETQRKPLTTRFHVRWIGAGDGIRTSIAPLDSVSYRKY